MGDDPQARWQQTDCSLFFMLTIRGPRPASPLAALAALAALATQTTNTMQAYSLLSC
jgi:hypothetical protein